MNCSILVLPRSLPLLKMDCNQLQTSTTQLYFQDHSQEVKLLGCRLNHQIIWQRPLLTLKVILSCSLLKEHFEFDYLELLSLSHSKIYSDFNLVRNGITSIPLCAQVSLSLNHKEQMH